MNLTRIIGAISQLDNVLAGECDLDEALMTITIDEKAFDAIVAEYQDRLTPRASLGVNRMEIAGVVVRKARPFHDGDQPELKREAS